VAGPLGGWRSVAMTFEQTWRALHIRQASLVGSVVLLALIPLTLAEFRMTERFALPVAAFLAFVAFGVGVWHHQLRCPACGQFFFRYVRDDVPIGSQNPFARRCVNCSCPIGVSAWLPGRQNEQPPS